MDCFACDARVDLAAAQRVGFRDTCDRCHGDLHVCRNCAFHDPAAYNECRESSAERVSDRERANRCDYFVPREGSGNETAAATTTAKQDLDALFKK
jgi:hypothetical protein